MAALSLGRHLWNGLRIPGAVGQQVRGVGALSSFLRGFFTPKTDNLQQCSSFHSSAVCNGLDEFFDDPKNWGEKSVKFGDLWTAKQLRLKSNEDLHKLWYVLLKEKNMLLTLEQEAKRQRLAMPSPERLIKINKSMERLDTIVTEREDALRLLQTGQEKPVPGDWRRNIFGETFWYTYKEWPMPWYMNRGYKRKKFFSLPYVNHYVRLKIEKELRIKARKLKAEREKMLDLQKRFPSMAKAS
ncbi:large ribosomal subunit protein uL29m [Discoglossus pictus]